MKTFQSVIQQSDIRKLRNAIQGFQKEITALIAGYNPKVNGKDEDLIKDLDKIEANILNVELAIESIRKGLRMRSAPSYKGRNEVFESDLGRIGQIRGDLILLQNQLTQLKQLIPDVRANLYNRKNNPLKIGESMIKQQNKVKKDHAIRKEVVQQINANAHSTFDIPTPSTAGVGLDVQLGLLTAVLCMCLARLQKNK